MKKIILFFIAVAGCYACQSGLQVSVSNTISVDRTEIIEIPAAQLSPLSAGKAYIVKDQQGQVIPSQLTYDNKLIFQVNIKAGESLIYTIKTGNPVQFAPKTYGRFITERKDDFAWENDRVAFRIYGPALVAVDGPSNGLDLWYKRTNDMIIDKWYKDDLAGVQSYHQDHGEGLDDFKVGRSLGAGMMAPIVNDTLVLNENFASQEILENGPLRTTFILTYKDITVDGKSFSESRTFSIDAGSQFTKVTQSYGTTDTIKVAAGIVKQPQREEAHSAYTDNGVAAVLYEEPESPNAGKAFVGMIFPNGLEDVKSNTYSVVNPVTNAIDTYSHVIGITTYYPGKPLTYYTGYGWEKFGFPSLDDFKMYIQNFSLAIENPLVITIL